MRLGIVCGSFHRDEVERMLEYARDERWLGSRVRWKHLWLSIECYRRRISTVLWFSESSRGARPITVW